MDGAAIHLTAAELKALLEGIDLLYWVPNVPGRISRNLASIADKAACALRAHPPARPVDGQLCRLDGERVQDERGKLPDPEGATSILTVLRSGHGNPLPPITPGVHHSPAEVRL